MLHCSMYPILSLLNCVGCVVTWLRGSVGPWVEWVNFLRGLRGLRGSIYFLRGLIFYVGHNFYVGCVGQVYFCVGPDFLRGSLLGSTFIYQMRLFYYTTTDSLENCFASLLTTNLDQTLFDLFIIFEQRRREGGSRTPATFQMEFFVTLLKG